ncbi:MAG: redoxin domain-containing protein [Pseudomonadota bacterium]
MPTKNQLLIPGMLAMLVISIIAAVKFISGAPLQFAWAGVFIATAPFPLFVTYISITKSVARTSARLPVSTAIVVTGFVIAMWGALMGASIMPALMATGGLVFFLWYVFIYSSFGGRSSSTVAVGNALPAFTLEDVEGAKVSSSDIDGPAIYMFYRGNWCPLCMAQIKEIAGQYRELAAKGVEVVLVSPQSHDETRKLADKFDVPFRFMVDRDLRAAHALDIASIGGTPLGVSQMGYGDDTVMPTVIATDANNTVIFLDETDNYRVRPEPETFLKLYETGTLNGALSTDGASARGAKRNGQDNHAGDPMAENALA